MGGARWPAVTGTLAEVGAGGLHNSGTVLACPQESLLQAGLNGRPLRSLYPAQKLP